MGSDTGYYLRWSDVEALLERIQSSVTRHASPTCGSCSQIKQAIKSEIELLKTRHKVMAAEPAHSVRRARLERKKDTSNW
jgi:hypothetical protein